ncbi:MULTISPECIES: glucosaminidase domain-containing protein [unclassified Mucilaginibacter]|uniref:glucosaminidase domain-containing protein n=1 Tax=unclassified Mucilaginibacter TaxID=2617802 RepID=UPI00138DA497|nr:MULTISPECIES: glucosaminidase domain-containing protein [unclassified Mucilaginibacter]MBB5397284.1 putative FlgJ-related protein [Mucilaginibacter sp. AK015]QHS54875.1 LysM peptidoglycan-binding domain-containing protein [Mucilaginibacter sp. 14171R-50]
MRRIYTLLIATLLFTSCSAHKNTISRSKASKNNKAIQKRNRAAIAAHKDFTSLEYIERFKDIAIQEMNTYGIPASITLAQGLFESGSGNSELAKVANNHFGIKCGSTWAGESYYKNDDNENDCFRVYNNPEESFRDHSEFLKKKNYARLFELDKNDFKGWAYGLKACGYATNPKYPQLLLNIITKYQLDQYDRPEGEIAKIKREDRVLTQINDNMGQPQQDSISKTPPDDKIYTVKQGDTLYNISKRFGITVDELRSLNKMSDNTLKIGQKIVVVK